MILSALSSNDEPLSEESFRATEVLQEAIAGMKSAGVAVEENEVSIKYIYRWHLLDIFLLDNIRNLWYNRGRKRENNMTNCIDITNLTTAQLDTLLNDLLAGKKTFKEAVAENPAPFSIIVKDEEKDEKDVKKL